MEDQGGVLNQLEGGSKLQAVRCAELNPGFAGDFLAGGKNKSFEVAQLR